MAWASRLHCLLSACLALSLSARAAADTLTVGGTGSSAPLLQILFQDFGSKEPGHVLKTVSPPLGSMGATRALAAGRIDLATFGREPRQDELRSVGQWFVLADTPFVLVTNDASAPQGLSLDELARIYRGQTSAWKSGVPIRLILRASFDTDTTILKSMSPAMATAVDEAARRSGMVTATDDIETLNMLTSIRGGFGPITLGQLRTTGASLQPIPIDGIAPSPASLKDGRYPWRKRLYVMLPQKPSALAERFSAYLRSGAAEAVLNRYGYVRDTPP